MNFVKDAYGNLRAVTKSGRFRKNWKVVFRKKSLVYLKEKCEICGSKKSLTIHHIIPLRKAIVINRHNCMTLCDKCHKAIEMYPILSEQRMGDMMREKFGFLDKIEAKLLKEMKSNG